MKTFREFMLKSEKMINNVRKRKSNLDEHETYKNLPGTSKSYRKDTGDKNKETKPHFHIFAKQKGRGEELFAVNRDGTGHDGSSGTRLSKSMANSLRNIGCKINRNTNMIENIEWHDVTTLLESSSNGYEILVTGRQWIFIFDGESMRLKCAKRINRSRWRYISS